MEVDASSFLQSVVCSLDCGRCATWSKSLLLADTRPVMLVRASQRVARAGACMHGRGAEPSVDLGIVMVVNSSTGCCATAGTSDDTLPIEDIVPRPAGAGTERSGCAPGAAPREGEPGSS